MVHPSTSSFLAGLVSSSFLAMPMHDDGLDLVRSAMGMDGGKPCSTCTSTLLSSHPFVYFNIILTSFSLSQKLIHHVGFPSTFSFSSAEFGWLTLVLFQSFSSLSQG